MEIRSAVERLSSVASWAGVLATIVAVLSYYGVYQKEMSEKLVYEAMSQRDISEKLESVIKESEFRVEELKAELTINPAIK